MEQPVSLDECEDLISYYKDLYEHGMEIIEGGSATFYVKAEGCRYAGPSHVAGDAGSPSLVRAPVDAFTRLGAESLTRDAERKIQLLEGLKRMVEAYENGKTTNHTRTAQTHVTGV